MRGTFQNPFLKMYFAMIDSDSFKEISKDAATVAVLIRCLKEQDFEPSLKRKRQLKKAGLWPPKENKEFSFPARYGEKFGIPPRAALRALKRLHDVGLIDRIYAGSAKKGDYAKYRMSSRWKRWPKSDSLLDWPRADMCWLKENDEDENQRRKVRDEKGRFLPRRGRKKAAEDLVAAISATTKASLGTKKTTTKPAVVAKNATNNLKKHDLVVANNAMFLRSPSSSGLLPALKKKNSNGLEVNGSQRRRASNRKPKPPVGGWVEEYGGMVP